MIPYVWMIKYNQEEESPGGLYWKLLEQDKDEIRANLLIGTLISILEQIKNPELKDKMTAKIASIIEFEDFEHNYAGISNILNQNEIEFLIEKEFEKFQKGINIDGLEKTNKKLYWFIKNLKACTKNTPDKQFEVIDRVLEIINSLSDKEDTNLIKIINTDIIHHVGNQEVKDNLIAKYYESLTEAGKKLTDFNKDREYIKKKTAKFSDVKIGLDPKMTIGCEIEADNIILANLINISRQQGIGDYRTAEEPTIAGEEFVTPIFHDKEDELSIFCAVCETLQELGFDYDEEKRDCGGHINIGLDYLDTANAILNFYELYGNAEEVLFHICNKEGQVIRTNIEGGDESFFHPISGKLGDREFDEEISRNEVIQMFASDNYGSSQEIGILGKKASVCIRDYSRLEFRMPNGSTDYNVWIDNIRLFGRMVEVSKEITDIMQFGAQNERDEEKLELKEAMKDDEKTLEEKLFVLMDLLFEDDEIKQIYMNRFYSVERATTIDYEQYDSYKVDEIRKNRRLYRVTPGIFKVADFQRVYHSRLIENGGFDENSVFVADYVPEDKVERVDGQAILGRMVESYANLYGITMTDVRRVHTGVVIAPKKNEEKDIVGDKDEL